MRWTEGAAGGYPGYTAGNDALLAFQQGFLLNDIETNGFAGSGKRLVDAGLSAPTAAFHKQGDVHFNQSPLRQQQYGVD